jgi:hypothetical protein
MKTEDKQRAQNRARRLPARAAAPREAEERIALELGVPAYCARLLSERRLRFLAGDFPATMTRHCD